MSPVMGLRKDMPGILLQEAYNSESSNIRFISGEVKKAYGLLADFGGAQPSGTDPIIHYHRLIQKTGDEYPFVFTKDKIYLWNGSAYVLQFTSNGTVTHWESITFNDTVIVTNGVDEVQKWNGTNAFEPLGTASGLDIGGGSYCTMAKHITVYENYIILGYVIDAGVTCPQRIRWCSIGDETVWTGGDSGAGYIGNEDFISGFGHYQGQLVIFKQRSIHRLWLVSASTVFATAPVLKDFGCIAPDSVINDGLGHLFYFATDKTFKAFPNTTISTPLANDIMTHFKDTLISYIRSYYNKADNEVWWAVPYGSGVENNNRVFVFKENYWAILDMAISAFGQYKLTSNLTWDSITEGWDSYVGTWDSTTGDEGAPSELAADFSGYIFQLNRVIDDKDGYIVLNSDLQSKGGLPFFKRILSVQTYFRNGSNGDTAKIEIKRDDESVWQDIGDVDLYSSTGESVVITSTPCDLRGKTFKFKISGSNDFYFFVFYFIGI